MAIEIVDFPIKNGDFPYVSLPEGIKNWSSEIPQWFRGSTRSQKKTALLRARCWTRWRSGFHGGILMIFPQTVRPHWGVLTVTVKGRCSIEVVSEASGIFPVNFHRNLRRVARHGCRGTGVLHCPVYTGSCDMSLCLSTATRPVLGSLHRDVAKKPLMEILFGDLSKRPLEEICAERALIQNVYRDLARRPLWQILYRDLVKRAEILLKDLV